MPRHVLRRIAVSIFAVLVVAAGVLAVVSGDNRFIVLLVYRRLVERSGEFDPLDPMTTRSDCQDNLMGGERAFVCAVRNSDNPPFGKEMPDRRLIAYGKRLCGVYTRADAGEAAAFRHAHGVDPREQAALLYPICPKAEADLDTAYAEEEAEMLAMEAEERAKCDQAPRHRPLIKPVKAIRQKEPMWTELPLEAFDEYADLDDGLLQRLVNGELVASAPGHLLVYVNSEYRMCVTTETYRRRPPVETKGWDHVVEAGYESTDGTLVLADHLSGVVLPDLAVRGKGHYRVRVHYAWLAWNGEERAGQRLLVMVYPGRGDDVVVHRTP